MRFFWQRSNTIGVLTPKSRKRYRNSGTFSRIRRTLRRGFGNVSGSSFNGSRGEHVPELFLFNFLFVCFCVCTCMFVLKIDGVVFKVQI